MKHRHQGDLIWRFQVADTMSVGIPSSLEVMRQHWLNNGSTTAGRTNVGTLLTDRQMMALDRVKRIDRTLERLQEKPVSHARVLFHRYGPEEHRPSLCEILPYISGIAGMTGAAHRAYERDRGKPPRARSNNLLLWLEALCHRVSIRAPQGDDYAVLSDVRCEAEALLSDAETTYEVWADRREAA
jgi:hypothetical protein